MALTRLEMVSEVLDNLARSSAGVTRSNTTLASRAATWLNRAQVYIHRRYDILFKRATASTVAAQQCYEFPTNMNGIYSITVQNGTLSWKLKCMMPWEFDRYAANPASDSTYQPRIYVPYKTTKEFELYPIPDSAYTLNLRYSYTPQDLITDDQTTDYAAVGIDVDDVLIKYATAEGYKWLQELVDSARWQSDAEKSMKEVYRGICNLYPDWSPTGNGFPGRGEWYSGDYWNNPFILTVPMN